jgi:hypothetical protein
MLIASGLLALLIGAAFVANVLERLVVDVETAQRGTSSPTRTGSWSRGGAPRTPSPSRPPPWSGWWERPRPAGAGSAHHPGDQRPPHLSVRDDGVGGAEPRGGSGLVGLADRVEALGGTIQVHSPAGQGTRLQIDLPIQERPSS